MRHIPGYVLLAVCLFVAYQGYVNASPGPQTEALAKLEACGGDPTCVLQAERPRTVRTDVVRRKYEWKTSSGPRTVTCTRTYIWLGSWACESAPGPM